MDKYVALNDRVEFINALKPEMVISLHANFSKDQNLSGTEIYVSDNNKEKEKSNALALNIKKAFDNQTSKIKKEDMYLLKNVNHPIAILEVGYLSNKTDRLLLSSENGQLEIAKKILQVIN